MASLSSGGAAIKKFKWFRYGDNDEEEKKAKIADRFKQFERATAERRELQNDWFDEYHGRQVDDQGGKGNAKNLKPFGFNFEQRHQNAPGMPGARPSGSSRYPSSSFDNAPGYSAYYNPYNLTSAPSQPAAYNQSAAHSQGTSTTSSSNLPDTLRLPIRSENAAGNKPFTPTSYVPSPLPFRPTRAHANPNSPSSSTPIYRYPGFSYKPAQGEAPTERPQAPPPQPKKPKISKRAPTAPKIAGADRRTTRSSTQQAQKSPSGSQPMSLSSPQQKSSSASQRKSSSSKSTARRNMRRKQNARAKAMATSNNSAA